MYIRKRYQDRTKQMFKYCIVSLTFIIAAKWSSAQIPNGGFEEWQSVLNYEKPVGWWTNQDTAFARFEKDTVAVEGNYSLKILPGGAPSWLGCESRAAVHANFNEYLPSNSVLSFYAKVLPRDSTQHNNVYLIVTVLVSDSTTHLGSYGWSTFEPIEEFARVEIPLWQDNISEMTIWIYGGMGGSPLGSYCVNSSISWIDDLAIDSATPSHTVSLPEHTDIVVFPNPATDYVTIPNGLLFLDLTDIHGSHFRPESDSGHIYLNMLPAGFYTVRFYDSTKRKIYIGRIIKPY